MIVCQVGARLQQVVCLSSSLSSLLLCGQAEFTKVSSLANQKNQEPQQGYIMGMQYSLSMLLKGMEHFLLSKVVFVTC